MKNALKIGFIHYQPVEWTGIMNTRSFIKKSPLPFSAEALFSWHTRPGAIQRLTPPWVHMEIEDASEGVAPDTRVYLKMGKKPFQTPWHARHTHFEPGRLFMDTQEKGPFHAWTHSHLFHPTGPDQSIMEDRIAYTLPLPPFGDLFGGSFMEKELERIFACRHQTLLEDMTAHRRANLKPLRILISGASGLIGSSLSPYLTTGGHRVLRLVRKKALKGPDELFWDPETGLTDFKNLEPVDVVIHLAGENIGQRRWNPSRKRLLIESRRKSTALLAETVSRLDPRPRVFISASAIGYYGERGENILTEEAPPGDLFISEICKVWEETVRSTVDPRIRSLSMRIGVGLSPKGGALGELLTPFKLGLGARIGTGFQYMSWIAIDDILDAFLHGIANETLSGPVNVVSPEPVTNREFTRTLARVLNRPALFTIPEKAIDLIFGEMGREILLSSARVAPEKLVRSGFTFRSPTLEETLRRILGKNTRRQS